MARRDHALDRLLDLDGFLAEVGGGLWIKIVAQRVPSDVDRPHGVGYSLTLHESSGRRVFGIDNAHPVPSRHGPSGRRAMARDHLHRDDSVRPYAYRDAESLLEDFWREVDAILKKRGIE